MHRKAAEYLKSIIKESPGIGIILGSGLGPLAEKIQNPINISYEEIPGFPKTTVQGHAGCFVFGDFMGKKVIAMQGRFHYYEGRKPYEIILPVRVMKLVGVEILIVTNAAGGINEEFKPGDIMLIKDHINLSGINPLIGKNDDEIGPRFPDMTFAYDVSLQEQVLSVAKEKNIDLKTGVYAMMSGPSYETPAEIKMLRIIGADAVGMSTVPEVIAANHAGMKVVGISCITNMAAGVLDKPLSHEEVIETAEKSRDKFIKLITSAVEAIR